MPFSEFVKSFKAASMLDARRNLDAITTSNLSHYDESDRKTIVRDLKTKSTEFMERQIKDYRVVLGNIAKRLMKRG